WRGASASSPPSPRRATPWRHWRSSSWLSRRNRCWRLAGGSWSQRVGPRPVPGGGGRARLRDRPWRISFLVWLSVLGRPHPLDHVAQRQEPGDPY
ncbi:MAG: hypothetical protein AVDCRST_MAG88-1800, partial [uncultured Thermomicrobiales bacterium]